MALEAFTARKGPPRNLPDWRDARAASIVVATERRGLRRTANDRPVPAQPGIAAPDAWPHRNFMSTPSEERRRREAALVRAVDSNPDATSPETLAAVDAFVAVLLDEGLLPEAAVIAFKTALTRSESLHRFEAEAREQLRSSLVSACIARYYAARVADEVRVSRAPSLRLVRDEEIRARQAPEASA